MLRSVKCDRTFLNGRGSVVSRRRADKEHGSVEYRGSVGDMTFVGWCCGEAKARKEGVTQLKSPMSTLSNFSYLCRPSVLRERGAGSCLLFEIELVESTKVLFFGFPNTIDHVLYGKTVVSLTVPGVSEGHARRVHLRDWGQREMWWPFLDKNHVARKYACSISPTCT